nr:putative glutathione S-transferase [uncultured bacterium]
MITLYHRSDCPFCWKVRIALAELEIDYQIVDTVLGEKHPEVVKHNPKGSVPVFIDGDCVIWESSTVLEYLDEVYGPGKLYPGSAAQRAQVRLLISYSDTVIGPALRGQIFEKRAKPEAEWDWELIHKSEQAWRDCLAQLETWLGDNVYFAEAFSAAECALLPRFGIAEAYGAIAFQEFPQLVRWFADMKQRRSYVDTYPVSFIQPS